MRHFEKERLARGVMVWLELTGRLARHALTFFSSNVLC
jgi:hypothetical protein